MKNFVKKFLKKTGLYEKARRFYHFIHHANTGAIDKTHEIEQMIQVSIMNQYKIISQLPPPPPHF
jgi:hypothetical protein